uniref:Phenazine biosynthesis-like domain-containing protein isoform X1 n=2 Tax=Hirondellea gigas TaxID=1518452 RepID=A0A6A7FQK1_9CRUS
MQLQVFTVDAFTDKPFSGNPAAVVLLNEPLAEEILQKIAAEFNISETSYLRPLPAAGTTGNSDEYWKSGSRFGLRWFTPTNEVILCGHATLAAAQTLFHSMGNTSEELQFETEVSGVLLARRNKPNNTITLDFPANCPVELNPEQHRQMESLVEIVKEQLTVTDVKISVIAKKLLVRIDDSCTRKQLEAFRPDDRRLLSCHDGSVIKGLIVTLKGHRSVPEQDEHELSKYDFVCRYFAVWNGISEDPVTGSAHTVLGPYWARLLDTKTLKCRQCSPRGGDLEVVVREDGRVDLTGGAVTVVEATITI